MSYHRDDDAPYSISPIEGKGLGLLATRPLSPGSTILSEPVTMHIDVPAHILTESDVAKAFDALNATEKASVLALHEGTAPSSSSLLRIFKANNFGSSTACWLHPTICRMNHSCTANATIDRNADGEALVIAERHIAVGEEICFSYNHELYETATARQRAILLQRQYGFQCKCAACWGNTRFRRFSDARRILIKRLKERLHGLQTSDFSLLEKIDPQSAQVAEMSESEFWIKEASPGENLDIPAAERAAKNVLLGRLREAEGLAGLLSAQCYLRAAEATCEQIVELRNIVVLDWARVCKKLMERAIELVDETRSPFDDNAQMLRRTWKKMSSKPCMRVALGFLDGTMVIPVAKGGSNTESPYAVLVTEKGGLKAVSRTEFSRLMSSQKGGSSIPQTSKSPADLQETEKSGQDKAISSEASNSSYKIIGAALTGAASIVAYRLLT